MPTYEYKCLPCGVVLEVSHKFHDDESVECINCKKPMTKGFGGGVGIHFKGTGFYETDYKNK